MCVRTKCTDDENPPTSESKMEDREKVQTREAGITAVIRDFYKEEPKYEYPQWKSGANLERDFFYLIEKPQRIREQGSTYEDVTEGMAHEIAEAIIIKHKEDEWTAFSPDQIGDEGRQSRYERLFSAQIGQ